MFPFKMPKNTAVFSYTHIINDGKPILYVTHDDENDWQFLCGDNHTIKDAMVIGIKEVFEMDKSIGILAKLPMRMTAERENINVEWKINK